MTERKTKKEGGLRSLNFLSFLVPGLFRTESSEKEDKKLFQEVLAAVKITLGACSSAYPEITFNIAETLLSAGPNIDPLPGVSIQFQAKKLNPSNKELELVDNTISITLNTRNSVMYMRGGRFADTSAENSMTHLEKTIPYERKSKNSWYPKLTDKLFKWVTDPTISTQKNLEGRTRSLFPEVPDAPKRT